MRARVGSRVRMNRRDEHRAWLNPHRAAALMQQRTETAIASSDGRAHPADVRLAGDAFRLRGIPVIGVRGGVGGVLPQDRPGHELAVARALEGQRLNGRAPRR